MTWSLNETESLSKKAARGAGMSWGMAEEAGKAVRWLCAAGLPGADTLAALLEQVDGMGHTALRPVIADGAWRAEGPVLCPLYAGVALGDRAAELCNGPGVVLEDVAHPLLLLPFVAWAADAQQTALTLSWDGARISRGPEGTVVEAEGPALQAASAARASVTPQSGTGRGISRGYRAEIDPQTASRLGVLAHRTYAPDSEESRLAGAGAGLSDND